METNHSFTFPDDETLPEPTVETSHAVNPELPIPTQEERQKAPEVAIEESELAAHAIEKRPEVMLPHVMEAYEKDQPLEGLREKHHEVKDDAGRPMTPISQVVSQVNLSKQQVSSSAAPPSYAPPLPSASLDLDNVEEKPGLSYKKAVYTGFTGGIIVISVILIYLVFLR